MQDATSYNIWQIWQIVIVTLESLPVNLDETIIKLLS